MIGWPLVPINAADRAALRRPCVGQMLACVAEGLARYFDVDTTLVRIALVVLTVAATSPSSAPSSSPSSPAHGNR